MTIKANSSEKMMYIYEYVQSEFENEVRQIESFAIKPKNNYCATVTQNAAYFKVGYVGYTRNVDPLITKFSMRFSMSELDNILIKTDALNTLIDLTGTEHAVINGYDQRFCYITEDPNAEKKVLELVEKAHKAEADKLLSILAKVNNKIDAVRKAENAQAIHDIDMEEK